MSGDLLLSKTHLSYLQSDIPPAWIGWVMKHAPVAIPYQHRDMFVKLLWAAPSLPPAAWPENLALEQIAEPPQPCLRVHEETSTHQSSIVVAKPGATGRGPVGTQWEHQPMTFLSKRLL